MPNIDSVFPYFRLVSAVVPVVLAVLIRILLGRNRFTRFLMSAATTWLAVNVFLAPFTDPRHLDKWLLP